MTGRDGDSIMRFHKSSHCTSGVHCKKCRDLEGGRKWRQSLVDVFEDLEVADFPCPQPRHTNPNEVNFREL